jgi:hypothetical protein
MSRTYDPARIDDDIEASHAPAAFGGLLDDRDRDAAPTSRSSGRSRGG